MTVSLTNNFLTKARGLIFEDSASVTWALNANSNQLTATATGSGGPVGANPSATIGLSAVDGSATTFLRSDGAPPLSQAIAPTWTGIHTFSGSGNGNAIVLSGIQPWINASGADGLTISATAAMTLAMGGNFTIDQSGNSIWQMISGAVTQQASAGYVSYTLYGASNEWTHYVIGGSTTNESFGQQIQAGTSSSDMPLNIINYANTHTLLTLYGDGGMVMYGATGGDKGSGTINVSGGFYVNGTALSRAIRANPTASVGLVGGQWVGDHLPAQRRRSGSQPSHRADMDGRAYMDRCGERQCDHSQRQHEHQRRIHGEVQQRDGVRIFGWRIYSGRNDQHRYCVHC